MFHKTNVTLTPERVQELLPDLVAGDEAAAEELILGYIRYVKVLLRDKGEDLYAVGIAGMVEAIRRVQAGNWEKGSKYLTAYVRKYVLGRVQTYMQKDFLIPIEPRAFKGKPNQILPMPALNRVSMSHHNKVLSHMALREGLDELLDFERQILVLRSEGHTLTEIETLTEIPKSTVHLIEQTALEKMRTILTEG